MVILTSEYFKSFLIFNVRTALARWIQPKNCVSTKMLVTEKLTIYEITSKYLSDTIHINSQK